MELLGLESFSQKSLSVWAFLSGRGDTDAFRLISPRFGWLLLNSLEKSSASATSVKRYFLNLRVLVEFRKL